MSAQPSDGQPSRVSGSALVKKFSVPVLFTDLLEHEGPTNTIKEQLAADMRRMDEEMTKFSTNLLRLYGQTTVQAGMTSTRQENSSPATWDIITKSPLVEEQGENKILKLQFDVSNYRPNEVSVKVLNNMLVVIAKQTLDTDNGTVQNEYFREFLLPLNTKPETVQSSLSKDGVLTVRAPLIITPENDKQLKEGRNSAA